MLLEHNIPTYNKAVELLENNGRCAIIQATGTGKSYILMELIENVFKACTVLVVVPSNALIDSYLLLDDYNKSYITFTTYSGLRTITEKFDVVVFDELHRAGAPTWSTYAKELIGRSKYYVGLTATPIRYLDNLRDMSKELFGEDIVYGLSRDAAVDCGVLPEFDYIAILSDVDEYINSVKDMSFDVKKHVQLLLGEYQLSERIKKHIPGHQKIIIFYPNIETLTHANDEIRGWFDCDVNIYQVHSKQSRKENKGQINSFNEDNHVSVIKTVDMLNEGIHLDGVTLGISARKTTSGNVLEQEIGRVLSASNKSVRPKFIDLVRNYDNVKYAFGKPREAAIVQGTGNSKDTEFVSIKYMLVSYDEVLLEAEDLMAKIKGTWSDYEDDVIKYYYPVEGSECYIRLFSRTKSQVTKRARLLGVARSNKWTDEENNILKTYYPSERDGVWKRLTGRSQSSIQRQVKKLGLTRSWSQDEDFYLLYNYETLGVDGLLCNLINCSREDLVKRLKHLGLYSGV